MGVLHGGGGGDKPAKSIMLLDTHGYHYWSIPTLEDLQWTQTSPLQLAF